MQESKSSPAPIFIDLGKQKNKRIKRLRRGQGRLMDDIGTAMADLEAQGVIGADAQPIIVVVRRKENRKRFKFRM